MLGIDTASYALYQHYAHCGCTSCLLLLPCTEHFLHRDGKTVISVVEFAASIGQGKIGLLAEVYFPRPSISILKALVILL